MTSHPKELAIDDVPEITSDIIGKLKELNIGSVSQLAVQIPIELAPRLADSEVDVEAASRLISNARKNLN